MHQTKKTHPEINISSKAYAKPNTEQNFLANEEALTDIESNTAWRDEEDEQIKINLNSKNKLKKLKKDEPQSLISGKDFQIRLREQFEKLNSKSEIYNWATADKSQSKYENEDSENEENENNLINENKNQNKKNSNSKNQLDNLLQTSKSVVESAESKDSNTLRISQMQDLNKDAQHKSIISSLEFSPLKENLAFTAGLDEKLKLFAVNESENKSANLKTINTQDLPIYNAKFSNSGTEILISGKKKHFFVYDLEADKLARCPSLFANKHVYSLEKMFVGQEQFAFGTQEGFILVHDMRNKCFRYDIKINGSVNSVCFDRNGVNLYAVGDQSEIYIFDLRKYRTCVNKVNDVGNFNTTCMDISRDNNFIATGKLINLKKSFFVFFSYLFFKDFKFNIILFWFKFK